MDGYFRKPYDSHKIISAVDLSYKNKKKGIKRQALLNRHNVTKFIDSQYEENVRDVKDLFAGKKILTVDDAKLNVLVMKKALKKYGVEIDIAYDGKEAVEKVANNDYDLVFMDCQMPVMDGFQATIAIRDFERKQKKEAVPIVALTADAMIGDREKCLSFGMNDYINKPFKDAQIVAIMNKWLYDKNQKIGAI